MRTSLRALTALSVAVPLAVLAGGPTFAAGKGRNRTTDTTAPSVAISTPVSGSTTGTSLTVTGSASDNVGVSSVSLQVDGGAWQPAYGTTSWSVPLSGFSAGTHQGFYAIFVYFFVQNIDGYLVVPYIARRTVDLAPAIVLAMQLLMGALFGILGVLFADPILATLKVVLMDLSRPRASEEDEDPRVVAAEKEPAARPKAKPRPAKS